MTKDKAIKPLTNSQLKKVDKSFTPIQLQAIAELMDRLFTNHQVELSKVRNERYTEGWNDGAAYWAKCLRGLIGIKD